MRWLQFLPILRSLLLIEPVVSIGVLQWVRYLLRKVESFDEPSRGSWQHERLCQKPLAVNVYCESGTIIIIKYWLNKPTCSMNIDSKTLDYIWCYFYRRTHMQCMCIARCMLWSGVHLSVSLSVTSRCYTNTAELRCFLATCFSISKLASGLNWHFHAVKSRYNGTNEEKCSLSDRRLKCIFQ